MMRLIPVAAIAFAIVVAACSSPTPETFTFTPVPYTVVPTGSTPSSELLIVDDDERGLYLADEVAVTVARDDAKAFTAWAKTVGFSVRSDSDLRNGTLLLLVAVPPGSADDAIAYIEREADNVLDVRRSVVATANDDS